MKVRKLIKAIAGNDTRSVEAAWMEAVEKPMPPHEARDVLDALVQKGHSEAAQTLAALAMEEQKSLLGPPALLELCKQMLLAVPDCDELRETVAELYKTVHGGHAQFDLCFRAAGLTSGQSPRRAIRTLDTCLALEEGMYLANRFDPQVIRFKGFDEVTEEIEFIDADGMEDSQEPKKLTDEFEILSAEDFRVLQREHPDQLKQIVKDDPHRALVGLCLARGMETTNEQVREALTEEDLLPASQWSRWWSRARNAIKKSDKLTLEGRNPVTITYHPAGKTLEEEFAPEVAKARTPQALLEILRTYCREAQARGVEINPDFAGRITEEITTRGSSLLAHRPADAVIASLALAEAAALGAPEAEDRTLPSPDEIMQLIQKPVEAIRAIDDTSLWPRAIQAVAQRPDAAQVAKDLLAVAPAGQIDQVAKLLAQLDQAQALQQAVQAALASPDHFAELCCWLWNCPPEQIPVQVGRVELLGKMLTAVFDLEHKTDSDRKVRKDRQQQLRNALSARDYAVYRQALEEMNANMAAVIKRRVGRADGLAQTVRDEMLRLLREYHPRLFLKETIDPWLDESVIYTTRQALAKRQEELRVLQEEAMPANARQIGEAAEQGDLRENADWQAAIEERDMLQARSTKMQTELAKCRPINPEDIPSDRVGIGTKVRLQRMDNQAQLEYTFLGPWDSDLEKNILAYTTPLAQALMGTSVGETAEVPMHGGTVACRVESIQPAL